MLKKEKTLLLLSCNTMILTPTQLDFNIKILMMVRADLASRLEWSLEYHSSPLSMQTQICKASCLKELYNTKSWGCQTKVFFLIILQSLSKRPAWALAAPRFPHFYLQMLHQTRILKIPVCALLAITFLLLNLRLLQLIRYIIILLVEKARTDVKLLYPPYEFRCC